MSAVDDSQPRDPDPLSSTHAILGGRYRLEESIGQGGMASVWRATDVLLHRPVAVKRLHGPLVEDPDLAERFQREALVVARLAHPALVKLLDRGEDAAGPFLVFELVDGEDLKTRLERDGRMHFHQAASICAQIARGLEHAHAQGVVHRDISAKNVLLTRDGHAKLADFGIAHWEENHEGLTHAGTMLGTSEYLAPEQARGENVDGRTDIYSLGVVFYECLTGVAPFTGAPALAVAIRHLSEPVPDPRDISPDVPEDLAVAVLTATAKDPDRRYPDAGRFAEVLEDVLAGREKGAPTQRWMRDHETGRIQRGRPRRRGPIVAVACAVVVAAAALALVFTGVLDGGSGDDPASFVALVPDRVVDWDPDGSGIPGENTEQVVNVTDGDPATTWATERYFGTGDFSQRQDKTGVGLRWEFAQAVVARELAIESPVEGARFEVRGGEESKPLATATTTGSSQIVPIPDGPAQTAYTLWFTVLPADDDGFRAQVGEVQLRGTANGE
jgi:eukaryotic-like serine/threonine-protein kinase